MPPIISLTVDGIILTGRISIIACFFCTGIWLSLIEVVLGFIGIGLTLIGIGLVLEGFGLTLTWAVLTLRFDLGIEGLGVTVLGILIDRGIPPNPDFSKAISSSRSSDNISGLKNVLDEIKLKNNIKIIFLFIFI